jgi:hypothetical protein
MSNEMTDEQMAVARAIADSRPIEGNAVAGSGKTRTLCAGASGIPQSRRVLAIAFGKANQVDLEKKLPETIDTRTFNGLGHRTWMRHTSRKLELDGRKIGRLTTGGGNWPATAGSRSKTWPRKESSTASSQRSSRA